jgi:hypothetical protein
MFVIEFDYRSDDGDRIVGPFESMEAAEEHLKSLESPDWRAEFSVVSLAAVVEEAEALPDEEMPIDEPEDGEELITEIPVHGVATVEGTPTGDGRGFRDGALKFANLPQPLGFEYVSTHGGDTSNVAIVGRIDTFEVVEGEARYTGVIFPHKPYAGQAIDGIADGSYTGVSVIVDSVTEDVTEEREKFLARLQTENEEKEISEMSPEELEAFVDEIIGDGTQPVRWFSEARIRRFDMVPTGAFADGTGYIALGHEFADELTPDQIEAAANALADCGCGKVTSLTASAGTLIIDLTEFTEEQLAEYNALDMDGQEAYAREHNAIVAAAFAPGTKDGPGWITHPVATSRIRRYWVRGKGAAKIKWGVPGDFNRCRLQLAKYVQNPDWLAGLCANMHKEALGVWPGQEGGKRGHSLVASGAPVAPLFSLVAAASPIDAEFFRNPNLQEPTGLTVDGDRLYGHVAAWNVCHIGEPEGPGRCTMAPRSNTGYAHFLTGNVMTTEGRVAVGRITMGTGHAGDRSSANSAIAHYDNTGAVVADIVTGEDQFGIWFSGKFRDNATDEQRYELEASGRLSGDWRLINGNYELVAALAVNVPGFPIPKLGMVASAALGLVAITAAGIVDFGEEGTTSGNDTPLELTVENVNDIAIRAVEAYVALERRAAMVEELQPVREALAQLELVRARRVLESMEA